MSTSRVVVVASSASSKSKKFSTSASTLGELKNQSEMDRMVAGDVEFIVKPGNVTLRGDDSVLPTGDFNLYIIPTKNKAGNVTSSQASQLGREIGEAITKAAQTVSTNEVAELKSALVETIEDFFGVTLDECPECDEALAEAARLARR